MQPFSQIQGINTQLNPIQSLQGAPGGIETGEGSEGSDKFSFASIIGKQVMGVNDAANEAMETTDKLLTGTLKNPHDKAIAGQKSGILLKLTTTACSKITSACTTLFQMQI